MNEVDRQAAVNLLANAAKSGDKLGELPRASSPASIEEALELQRALVVRLGGDVVGWKVATDVSGTCMWGAIFTADSFSTPAAVNGDNYNPMGVEAEIAFRFDRDLPSRVEPYSRIEIEEVLTAFPAIEIVSSRFGSYQDTPTLDRLVDRMSNGGLVLGKPKADWRKIDLSTLRVTLECNGDKIVDQIGGHSKGDPLLPALDFIRAVQATTKFNAGEVITTGTFTGLRFGKPGQKFRAEFEDFGMVELTYR